MPPKKDRICPPNKILNPKTNRFVLRSGRIGKKLVAQETKGEMRFGTFTRKQMEDFFKIPRTKKSSPRKTHKMQKKKSSAKKKKMVQTTLM